MDTNKLTALAARKGRQMKYYADSWTNLRKYLVENYPDQTEEWYDTEATRQADAYHRVAGAEVPNCG
ncbi:hypothetical protein QDW26_gp58 [Microbacterium phage Didgeridoo]|uniref:hypothetical protein n=1 Tax=Microbacterium phage Didgeridoo TaxID=2126928 RepID=UPI000D2097AC|nr:hypothetical protein QDW26_gp58 [Microbacterium phage Didgeridoo]AVR56724.1 hypothetical protein PBI_DIDGERIDOO_59 [Microbacterium phage Didgeridoo]